MVAPAITLAGAAIAGGTAAVAGGGSCMAGLASGLIAGANAISAVLSAAVSYIQNCMSQLAEFIKSSAQKVSETVMQQVAQMKEILKQIWIRCTSESQQQAMSNTVSAALDKIKFIFAWISRYPKVLQMGASTVSVAGQAVQTSYTHKLGKIEEEKSMTKAQQSLGETIHQMIMNLLKLSAEPLKKSTDDYREYDKQILNIETNRSQVNGQLVQNINHMG